MNKNLAAVAKAQAKDIRNCINNGARGRLSGSIEDCLTSDPRGKVAKAKLRTVLGEVEDCIANPPGFGASNAATVNDVATLQQIDLTHAIFGLDLDAAIVNAAEDKNTFECQQAVVKSVDRCRDTRLKTFNKCKKAGVRDGSITDAVSLRSVCLDADPRGKIAKFCDPGIGKIGTTIATKCADTVLSNGFTGCNTDSPEQLAACIDQRISCHVCLTLAQGDQLGTAVCDLFDNSVEDSSCGDLPQDERAERCGPGDHWIDGPCDGGSDVLIDAPGFVAIDLDQDCLADISLNLSGDVIIQRSSSIDRSINFPGSTDCNGSSCGVVDGHLDVIDTEIVSMSLNGGDAVLRIGDTASSPLWPSLGTIIEKTDPALADSFFNVFFELEVDGIRLYNHAPARLQAEIRRVPPDATYLGPTDCLPLFDDASGGVEIGALVGLEYNTNR
jgi:hypothetical protein